MQQLVRFFRRNPQVLVLVIICLVLGIGTFLAVLVGLIGSGSTQVTGEPSGVIAVASAPEGTLARRTEATARLAAPSIRKARASTANQTSRTAGDIQLSVGTGVRSEL